MAKHKSKLERFQDICDMVFFSDSKKIKPVPYQVAKEIKYPQSHTSNYMNELARKKILLKNKKGEYSLPKFKNLKEVEKNSKYYSLRLIDTLRSSFEKPKLKKESKSLHTIKKTKKQEYLNKDIREIDEHFSYFLDIIEDFPLSFFIFSKKSLLFWVEQELKQLKKASTYEDILEIRRSLDKIIEIVQESTNVIK